MTEKISDNPVSPNIPRENFADFYAAVRTGNKSVVMEYLDKYDVSFIDEGYPGDWTALILAAYHGQIEIAALLLENGADTGAKNDYYDGTALMWAARHGHTDITALLLDKENMHADSTNDNVEAALRWAEKWCRDDIAILLQQWLDTQKQLQEESQRQKDKKAMLLRKQRESRLVASRVKKLKECRPKNHFFTTKG